MEEKELEYSRKAEIRNVKLLAMGLLEERTFQSSGLTTEGHFCFCARGAPTARSIAVWYGTNTNNNNVK